ncbi:MAG: transposase [Spirosomataceae bacterium]
MQEFIPLTPNHNYHIYSRGINGEKLFKSLSNCSYFLKKYHQYIHPVADTLAYCLMGNHFHISLRIKSVDELTLTGLEALSGLKTSEDYSKFISKQFSNLFNSYAQSINKAHGRTGGLFETPFKRELVENDGYLKQLICYIHLNPIKHNFTDNFRTYPHSSFQSILSDKPTNLRRLEVIELFGGSNAFIDYHEENLLNNFGFIE